MDLKCMLRVIFAVVAVLGNPGAVVADIPGGDEITPEVSLDIIESVQVGGGLYDIRTASNPDMTARVSGGRTAPAIGRARVIWYMRCYDNDYCEATGATIIDRAGASYHLAVP
jgi:hypothetical protein